MTQILEQSPVTPDRCGQTIADRYRILRWLGAGGMGEVYEAEHILLGRKVALKLLQQRHLGHPQLLRRFRREARATALFQSEHIVATTDFGFAEGGLPFMVMELPRGEDLKKLLEREGRLAPVRAVNLVLDVCRGLDVVHSHGMTHRDLKPSNLMVVRTPSREVCKILDFGIVKFEHQGGLSVATEIGTAMGTLNYMSPEQARGDAEVDRRADLYSVGAILYQCLTGVAPFTADAPHVLLYKINHEAAVHVSELNPDLPPGLADVVMLALSKTKEARYQSAVDMAAALNPFGGKYVLPLLGHASAMPAVQVAQSNPLTETLTPSTAQRHNAGRGMAPRTALSLLGGAVLGMLAMKFVAGSASEAKEVAQIPAPTASAIQSLSIAPTKLTDDAEPMLSAPLPLATSAAPESDVMLPKSASPRPPMVKPSSPPAKPKAVADFDTKDPYE